jgi:hypothetical protein
MAKSKLRIRRLTLAPGGLRRGREEDDNEAIDGVVAARILAKEHLHRAVEVSIESSLMHKSGRQVHGIDDRFSGRFWTTGNESDSETNHLGGGVA